MFEKLPEPLLVHTGDSDNLTPVSQAILNGYAPGNELYTYADFPEITLQELSELRDATFSTVFYNITQKLLGDAIPDEVASSTAKDAYNRKTFDLDNDNSLRFITLPSGIHICGLSDGPTGAFKDMAMQPFARWMSYLQKQEGKPLTIMLSTSGDTGPAALHAFSGLPNTEIINMLPAQGVSLFQWSQMAELAGRNGVHVLEVAGDFSYINDLHMKADLIYDLSAVNSVNIARIIAQVPYHVAAYLKAIRLENKSVGDSVDVSIPSGNFGNALSAIIARKMGLPLRNIIVATNENNTLDRLIKTGIFELSKFQHTDSSAQDVRMPSNVWRYFAMLFRNDPEKISRVYNELTTLGSVALNSIGISDASIQEGVISTTVDAAARTSTIRKTYEQSPPHQRVIVDPHTANGIAAIEQLGAKNPDIPMVAMETAKPFKFNEAMKRILGIVPPRPERFKGLEESQKGKRLVRIMDEAGLLAYMKEQTNARLL